MRLITLLNAKQKVYIIVRIPEYIAVKVLRPGITSIDNKSRSPVGGVVSVIIDSPFKQNYCLFLILGYILHYSLLL